MRTASDRARRPRLVCPEPIRRLLLDWGVGRLGDHASVARRARRTTGVDQPGADGVWVFGLHPPAAVVAFVSSIDGFALVERPPRTDEASETPAHSPTSL
jgi:hypothetical protein